MQGNVQPPFATFILTTIRRFTRFAVVITGHSDPESGNIHIVPNNGLCTDVQNVCLYLFS